MYDIGIIGGTVTDCVLVDRIGTNAVCERPVRALGGDEPVRDMLLSTAGQL